MNTLTGKVVDRTIATHATIDIIGEVPARAYGGTSFEYRPTGIDVHSRSGTAGDLDIESFKVYLFGLDDDGESVTETFSDGVGYRNRLADLPAWVLEVIISTGIRVPQYIVDKVKEVNDDEHIQEHSIGQAAGEPEGRTDPEQSADSDDRPGRSAIVVVDGSDELPDTPSDVIDKD
jgi:hypothetical protein